MVCVLLWFVNRWVACVVKLTCLELKATFISNKKINPISPLLLSDDLEYIK